MGGYPVSQRFVASQSRSTIDVQEKAEQTLRTELNILRTQMEELNRKQTEDQEALKQARDARFAKDGEVSILRNNIEKINQQHAAEVAKLTAAKEIAESMQAQLRQQMREEIDRVKTQYAFRQHEMEASVRTTPLALHGSEINRQSTISSPIASSQMRQWNAGPSAITQTPRKSKFTPCSPKAQRIRNVAAHEKFVDLPGFQSGFDSTPLKNKGKGKERARELPADDVFLRPAPLLMPPPSSPPRAPADSRGSGDVAIVDAVPFPSVDLQKPPGLSIPPASSQNADVEMSDTEKSKDESIQESLTVVKPPDWNKELQHIIFTHHPRSRPSQLTFHLAIKASIPASDLHQTVVFAASSRRLLEALGASPSLDDWGTHLSVISNSLISMAHALAISNSIIPLTALLGLIRTLAYSIPSFTASLLSLSSVAEDGSPEVMTTLHDIVKLHLNPARKHSSVEETIDIGSEVTLGAMLSDHDVLMMMISPAQPPKTLVQVTRALAFLASQPTLYKHFLFAPRGVDANPGEDEFHWTPQIEQLAAYLIRDGPEVLELQENVLAFIATLSTAHPDALTIVSGSNTLIPGMIVFLSNVSSPLWEDDDDLMASPERVTTLVRLIVRTMTLLYYMICSRSPKYNLARRLQIAKQHVAHRTFNTLDHAFMVTFGRFSFADAPEWIDDAGKAHLEGLSGMARQVLELVVDGPELELIWGSFQPDPEGPKKAPIDLEEDEEMLMDQVIDS
ncbi:hypothetical protein EUX98_g7475 [Antrodiella citrinella]|uniref:Uncharacterized protein n=1 Tax=Antrodiella citrinella TaxID=2447956 RepID=A0A4S4MTR6_9APHY|nr:hypothetical protein EUX98_g7475 [Antrodiella citrinella]